jgi:hypothetical protein
LHSIVIVINRYNGNLVGLGMSTFSPLLRWSSLNQHFAPIYTDHSFDSDTPTPSLDLSTGDAWKLLFALLCLIAFFSCMSTIMQEAFMQSIGKVFKVFCCQPEFVLAISIAYLP